MASGGEKDVASEPFSSTDHGQPIESGQYLRTQIPSGFMIKRSLSTGSSLKA